jgi:hypothetical protein
MESGVVGMGVADEGKFVAGSFGFVRIEPKSELGQEDAAAVELNAKR